MTRLYRLLLIIAAGAVALTSSETLLAQSSDRAVIDEITVTAQKREQTVFEIPMAISVLDAGEIKGIGATTLGQMQATVPSLVVTGGNGAESISIRGISPPGSTLPTVARYVDEMAVNAEYIAYGLGFPLVDIDRVEVLKGPQGTLWGDGAIGGVVRYITKDPLTGSVDGNFEVTGNTVRNGDTGYRANISGNVISNETFGARLTAHHESYAGWIENSFLGDDHNEDEISLLRLKTSWAPSERFRADLLVQHFESELMPDSAFLDQDFVNQFLDAPTADVEYDLVNLVLRADLGFADFTSSTGYVDNNVVTANDVSLSYAAFGELFFPGLDVDQVVYWTDVTQEAKTQEFRLSSKDTGGRVFWTGGLYYRDAEGGGPVNTRSYPDMTPVGALEGSLFTSTEAWAAFGEVDFGLNDELSLILGLRRYEDERTVENLTTGYGLGFLQFSIIDKEKFDSTVFRAALNWRYSDEHMAYLSASEGFRSGNFQFIDLVAFGITDTNTVLPEELITYELGIKGRLSESNLQYEIAAFYSDYDNIQVYFPNAFGVQAFDNGGKATIEGLEAAFNWNATEDLLLRATYGRNRSQYKQAGLTHLPGDPLDNVPQYTFSLMADWAFNFSPSVPGNVRVDYLFVGEKSVSLRGFNFPGTDPVTVTENERSLNVRLGMTFNDNYTLTAYVENATDERGITGNPGGVLPWYTQQRPRTVGLTLAADFGK